MATWEDRLLERKKGDLFRSLKTEIEGVDFLSNNYLGLAEIHIKSNLSFSSTGSRLLSGNKSFITDFEKKIALHFNSEEAIVIPSGYQANLAVFSSIADRNSMVFYDEYCHASIRDGIRLSNAKSRKFSNNNLGELEDMLRSCKGKPIVAMEALYSMDGNSPDPELLKALKTQYDFYLVLDEAHSFGIYGKEGKGWANAYGLDDLVDVKVLTLGKAGGYHGAVILCSSDFKVFISNFSRPFIFSTAPDSHFCTTVLSQIERVKNAEAERGKLFENIAYLKNNAGKKIVVNDSPVAYIPCAGNKKADELALRLQEQGIQIKAIKSPTVPEGMERLRLCIHSFNTREEINCLLDLLP